MEDSIRTVDVLALRFLKLNFPVIEISIFNVNFSIQYFDSAGICSNSSFYMRSERCGARVSAVNASKQNRVR